jgi:hypothetical protein
LCSEAVSPMDRHYYHPASTQHIWGKIQPKADCSVVALLLGRRGEEQTEVSASREHTFIRDEERCLVRCSLIV